MFLTIIKLKIQSSGRRAIDRDVKLNKAVYISLKASIGERQGQLTKTFGFGAPLKVERKLSRVKKTA